MNMRRFIKLYQADPSCFLGAFHFHDSKGLPGTRQRIGTSLSSGLRWTEIPTSGGAKLGVTFRRIVKVTQIVIL